MKHFKILLWFESAQVKWYMKSNTKNIVSELPNVLRPRILGNSEIMGKKLKNKWRQSLVPSLLSTKIFLVVVVKNYTKTDIKVSSPVQF